MSESKTENQEHQKGRKLGWKLREARYPFRNEVMTLREDHLDVPKIGAETFAYVEQGGAVMIVPLTDDGQIVFIRQYRYPVDAFCLEVPAGKMSDTPDLSIEEVAAKELFEEIGGKASRLELMGSFYTNPSLGDEECHYFLAHGVEMDRQSEPEPLEKIEIRMIPAAEAVAQARAGKFRNAPSALAILLAEPPLRELGWL